jgi:hypothetical protein
VSRPEDGGGRLAMTIMEPLLSLVMSHTLRTLDRSSGSALPVLTMALVKKAAGTASPPQAAATTRAAAPEQAPASVPVPAIARGPLFQLGGAAAAAPDPKHVLGGNTQQVAAASVAQQPSRRVTRASGSGGQAAPTPSVGVGSGDDPQAQGRRTRKRCAADAAVAAAPAADGADVTDTDADAPPAKKGRRQSHGQLSSGPAKATQKRKAPDEQQPEKTKPALHGIVKTSTDHWRARRELVLPPMRWCSLPLSVRKHTTYRFLYMHAVRDCDARCNVHLGTFGSEEEAARAHDRGSIVFNGAEAKTNVRACVNMCTCVSVRVCDLTDPLKPHSPNASLSPSPSPALQFPITDYKKELPKLSKMSREDVVAFLMRGSSCFAQGSNTFRGARSLAQTYTARRAAAPCGTGLHTSAPRRMRVLLCVHSTDRVASYTTCTQV